MRAWYSRYPGCASLEQHQVDKPEVILLAEPRHVEYDESRPPVHSVGQEETVRLCRGVGGGALVPFFLALKEHRVGLPGILHG